MHYPICDGWRGKEERKEARWKKKGRVEREIEGVTGTTLGVDANTYRKTKKVIEFVKKIANKTNFINLTLK